MQENAGEYRRLESDSPVVILRSSAPRKIAERRMEISNSSATNPLLSLIAEDGEEEEEARGKNSSQQAHKPLTSTELSGIVQRLAWLL